MPDIVNNYTNEQLEDAAYKKTGLDPSEIPLNSDLGTAAYSDIQTSPSDATAGAVLNNETTHIGGNENWTSANLSPYIVGGVAPNVICGTCLASSSTSLVMTRDVQFIPQSITVNDTFQIRSSTGSVIDTGLGGADITLATSPSGLAVIIITTSGLTGGDLYTIRTESALSTIVVNP